MVTTETVASVVLALVPPLIFCTWNNYTEALNALASVALVLALIAPLTLCAWITHGAMKAQGPWKLWPLLPWSWPW